MLTMGSLFDGIGGFPLAAIRNGVTPLWASEIEAFPIEVTKIRFPDMLHVGDITKLNGAALPPVDVICGGSPCQDLSIAGNRAGLAGKRSGLFMEQTRIAKEMRKADEQRGTPAHLIRPRFLVWENVPGAFSSAEGEDFRAVIEEIVRIKHSTCDVPRPDTGAWQSAGAVFLGTEFSLAWRVLDAQYWGVAQRRRRIFLVADFGGLTAPEILFKQDSLFGHTSQSRSEGKGTATPTEAGTDGTGRACLTPWDVQSRRIFEDKGTWPALYGGEGGGHGYIQTEEKTTVEFTVNQYDTVKNMQMKTFAPEPLMCLNDHGGERIDITEEVTPTLRASMGGHQPLVFDNHAQDVRFTGPVGVSQTVSAGFGMGGNNQPLVITNPNPSKSQWGIALQQETICIAGNTIDRQPQNGGNGLGCQTDIAYTLTATDHHAIFNWLGYSSFGESEVAGTQCRRQYKDATDLIAATYQKGVGALYSVDEKDLGNQYASQDKCNKDNQSKIFGEASYNRFSEEGISTLRTCEGTNGGESDSLVDDIRQKWPKLIRRLTPLECERLQGFPDGWTLIPNASDSARYKALGNSVAIPCVEFLLRGIAYFLLKIKEEDEKEPSL